MARRFRWPWRSPLEIRREVDEELEFHLAMRTAELAKSGRSLAEARAAAEREFGDLEETRRYCGSNARAAEQRRRWRDTLLDLRGDLLVSLRAWRRNPSAAVAIILTLGLAIGATGAVFSIVDGVLFKALPYRDSDRVVAVYQYESRKALMERPSPGNFLDWRERLTRLEIAAAEPYGVTLLHQGAPTSLSVFNVTEGYFRILGVDLGLGRDFRPDEHVAGRDRVAILSHPLWLTRFGGDPGLIGQRVELDGDRYEVVGVLPPRIEYPDQRDLYLPKVFRPDEREARSRTYYRVAGRLAPGSTLAQAQAEFEQTTRALAAEYPVPNANVVGRLVPVGDDIAGRVRGGLLLMLVTVGLVMLVACINVAGLLTTRAAYRRTEFAVRLALGAGRGRLTRLALIEGVLLASAASLLGWLTAVGATKLAVFMAPADLPRISAIRLDVRVLAVLVASGVVTALICGWLPARDTTAIADSEAFRNRLGGTRAAGLTGRGLVVAEVALAVSLLMAAGLLGRSFLKLTNQDLGYATDQRLLATVHVWDRFQAPEQLTLFADQAVAELVAIPGVRRAAAANALPLSAVGSEMDPPYLVEGEAPPPLGQEPTARSTIVTSDYFDAMGIPLLAGRLFGPDDRRGSRRVIVVSKTLASRTWPNADPLGRALLVQQRDSTMARLEVVGVVGDTRFAGHADRLLPEYYVPLSQRPFGSLTFVVHAAPGQSVGPAAVQAAFARVDGSIVVSRFEQLDTLLAGTLATRQFILGATMAFAVIAILLAAIGLYGLLSFLVAQRRPEIGIRMALGANRANVLTLIAKQGVSLAAVGLLIGIVVTLLARRWLAAQLWGVDAADPTTFLAMAAATLIIALVASVVPALRAGRVDPMASLRGD